MTTTATITFSNCPICIQRQPTQSVSARSTFKSLQQLGRAYFDHLRTHVHEAVHGHYNLPSGLATAGIDTVLKHVCKQSTAARLDERVVEQGLVNTLRHRVMKSDTMKDSLAHVLGAKRLGDVLSDDDYRQIQKHLDDIARIILRRACNIRNCSRHHTWPTAPRRPARMPWGRGPKRKHPHS